MVTIPPIKTKAEATEMAAIAPAERPLATGGAGDGEGGGMGGNGVGGGLGGIGVGGPYVQLHK